MIITYFSQNVNRKEVAFLEKISFLQKMFEAKLPGQIRGCLRDDEFCAKLEA